MNNYEIRLIDGFGNEYCRGYGMGDSAMAAAEQAVQAKQVYVSPERPVYVLAINMATGLGFKFEMAQAT